MKNNIVINFFIIYLIKYIYLDISNLKRQIIDKVKPINYKLDDQTLLVDYVFICFFLGNDFIQHTPSINTRYDGLNILLNTYNKLNDLYDGRFNLIDLESDNLIDIKKDGIKVNNEK